MVTSCRPWLRGNRWYDISCSLRPPALCLPSKMVEQKQAGGERGKTREHIEDPVHPPRVHPTCSIAHHAVLNADVLDDRNRAGEQHADRHQKAATDRLRAP